MSADLSGPLECPQRVNPDVGTLREAQVILERYRYSFLAKKIGKMVDALEFSSRDDDA